MPAIRGTQGAALADRRATVLRTLSKRLRALGVDDTGLADLSERELAVVLGLTRNASADRARIGQMLGLAASGV